MKFQKNENPANFYRNIRSYIFATHNKNGSCAAYRLLNSFRKDFSSNIFYGLKAELDFWNSYAGKFNLTPALDCGDHSDFVGSIRKARNCRIDVTTNLKFKDLDSYGKFQKQNKKYYIALMDRESGKLLEMIDINFPFCKECGGRMFNLINLMPETNLGRGDHSQVRVSLCSLNPYEHFFCGETMYNFPIHTFRDTASDLEESGDFLYKRNVDQVLMDYGSNLAKFFRKDLDENIVGVGDKHYFFTDLRNGDGFYGLKLFWIHPLISNQVDTEIESDFGII